MGVGLRSGAELEEQEEVRLCHAKQKAGAGCLYETSQELHRTGEADGWGLGESRENDVEAEGSEEGPSSLGSSLLISRIRRLG